MTTATKPRTISQLNKLLSKYIKKWKTQLFLNTWIIHFEILDYLANCDGYSTVGTCDTKWQYFEAHLKFSLEEMRDMEEAEIEKIVIHELLHAVVNEMREDGLDHEERVVSHLTMVFDWMNAK